MRDYKSYMLWDNVTPQAVTSSTDATPIVVTKATHGYSTGDIVSIYGHTTNVAANGMWKITVVTANTFSLQNLHTGANVAGSGAGAGSSGVVTLAPKIAWGEDFTHAELQFGTTNSGSMTVKMAGSFGIPRASQSGYLDLPNFGATVAPSNPYAFLQMINVDDNVAVDGTTGIVLAGTDVNKNYEVNINAVKYICPILTAWTAGKITARLTLYSNQ